MLKRNVESLFQEKLTMYPHLKKVRERLWTNETKSRVSIMVGAGFSLNAKKIEPSFKGMSLWEEIKERLLVDLNHRPGIEKKDVLEIGQIYADEYGRSSLDEFLKEAIPDENYEPAELHHKLLNLPWTDIYTTNYDSLLERAKKTVYERNYQVIYDISDIPSSVQPRIVKLHGSFPAHRPFIFTEKDYEEYRVKFSPFVNMVQQSIMETTFVLIGFSGNDPNFHSWITWVSNNLKDHMPKIYMIGYNEEGKRRELEKKGITLIDFKEIYKKEENPYYSMYNDIFDYLAYENRKEKTKWPYNSKAYKSISLEELRSNRADYPGWISMPDEIRRKHTIDVYTETQKYLRNLSVEDPIEDDTLDYLNEILWCYDKFSLPFEDVIREKIQQVIHKQPKISKKSHLLIIKLLKEARLNGNEEEFTKYHHLCESSDLNKEEFHNFIFEKILYCYTNNNLNEVNKLMESWKVSSEEIEWGIKKAIIYSRLGEKVKAKEVFEEYLQTIRRLLAIKLEDYRLLSLESIILHNLKRVTHQWDYGDDRLRMLNSKYCDVNKEFDRTVVSIKKYTNNLGTKEIAGFDPGSGKITTSFGDYITQEILDSYAVLEMQENLGLTIRDNEQFDLALKNLEILYPLYSLLKRIYYASYKKIEEIFSRAFIFNLHDQHIEYLAKLLEKTILNYTSSILDTRVSLEVISRIYLGLSSENQHTLDIGILRYLDSEEAYQLENSRVLSNVIKRIIYAKNKEELQLFYELLICSEIRSQKSEDVSWYRHVFFEPFLVVLKQKNGLVAINIPEERLNEFFDVLRESTDYSVRESTLIRLVFLVVSESLTSEYKEKFISLIEELPRNRKEGISDFIYGSMFQALINPQENKSNASLEEFVKKEIPSFYIKTVTIESTSLSDYFHELTRVFPGFVQTNAESRPEYAFYKQWLEKFYIWWDNQKEGLFKDLDNTNFNVLQSPDHLKHLIVVLKNNVWSCIPKNLIEESDKQRAKEIFMEINERRSDLSYHLLPSIERMEISTDIGLDSVIEGLIDQDNRKLKAVLGALYDYLMLGSINEVRVNINLIKHETMGMLKYGSGKKLSEVLELMQYTIKNRPYLFESKEYEEIIACIAKYLEGIQKNYIELSTPLDFEILSKYADLMAVITEDKEILVSKEFNNLNNFTFMHRLPEVKAILEAVEQK